MAYSFGSSLSRGRFWRRCEFSELRISNLWLSLGQICPRQKISTNHFQAVTPGPIVSEHQASSLEGFLDDR